MPAGPVRTPARRVRGGGPAGVSGVHPRGVRRADTGPLRGSRTRGGRRGSRPVNLSDLVRDAAEDFPAKEALVFRGRSISFAELDERVDLTAAALAGLG